MSLAVSLMAVGMPTEQAVRIGYENSVPLDGNGTIQATATPIIATNNNVALGTIVGQTAFILPADAELFQEYFVLNTTADAALIYPPIGDTINDEALNAAVAIPLDTAMIFMRVEDGRWVTLGSGGAAVESIVAGPGISIDATDPQNPIVSNTGVLSVTAGTGVTLGGTAQNPIINAPAVGTVTSVSVASANGFAGSVTNPTSTPDITITTTVNAPALAGNGTAIAAATTTGSGSTVVLNNTPTLITPVLGAATGTSIVLTGSISASAFIPSSSVVPTNGLYLPAANTLGWAVNSAAELQLTSTALSPAADGGSSLGTTALGWQNLFGNTGFVINVEGGNWVATHTSGILTVGTGDLRVTTAGTNTASVVTVGGTQTLTGKTLTSPTLTTPALGTPASGVLTNATGLPIVAGTTGTLTETRGGTNQTTYTTGDLLYASGANTLAKLAIGSSTQVLTVTGGVPVWATGGGGGTMGTPVASTSGTSIDFTGIPTGTKEIHINFIGVSTNGASPIIVQIGDAGGVETSGYLGTQNDLATAGVVSSQITGAFGMASTQSSNDLYQGKMILTLENSSNNTWTSLAICGQSNSTAKTYLGAGTKSLSAVLDRVRITTVIGSQTFDAGEVNIVYWG